MSSAHTSDILVNVHFNNLNTERVVALFLFYKIRVFAAAYGGCFDGFEFTKNERYVTLPELIRLGWVTDENRVIKYRNLCNQSEAIGKWVKMPISALTSLASFKGFLISSAEAYILNRNSKIQEGKSKVYSVRSGSYIRRDWVERRGSSYLNKVKKISSEGVSSLEGRVYLNTVSSLLGLSNRTLSRWRKDSENTYTKKYVQNFDGRDISMHFYSKSSNKYLSVDHKVRTSMDIFNNKFYSGLNYV